MKPRPGQVLLYADIRQEEYGIAACLSGDKAMWQAYAAGDYYLSFAIMAGALPQGTIINKDTPPEIQAIRDKYKQCCLAIMYGQEAEGLARRAKISPILAERLIRQHKDTFPGFWAWTRRVQNQTTQTNTLWTRLGWVLHIKIGTLNSGEYLNGYPNPRSIRNYPMQAGGGDILRVATILATEAGLELVATVHDALMIVTTEDRMESDMAKLKDAIQEGSRKVLGDGYILGVNVKEVHYPQRYIDKRVEDKTVDGKPQKGMWNLIMDLLAKAEEADRTERQLA